MKLSHTSNMNSTVADTGHTAQCFVLHFLITLSCLYTFSSCQEESFSNSSCWYFSSGILQQHHTPSVASAHSLCPWGLGRSDKWVVNLRRAICAWHGLSSFPLGEPVSLQKAHSCFFPGDWPLPWANPAVTGGKCLSISGLRYHMHIHLTWSSISQTKLDQQSRWYFSPYIIVLFLFLSWFRNCKSNIGGISLMAQSPQHMVYFLRKPMHEEAVEFRDLACEEVLLGVALDFPVWKANCDFSSLSILITG